jgi:hypothetical protein
MTQANERLPAAYEACGGCEAKRDRPIFRLEYLPANQAWALMYHDQVLRIFSSKDEAQKELDRILDVRHSNEAGEDFPSPQAVLQSALTQGYTHHERVTDGHTEGFLYSPASSGTRVTRVYFHHGKYHLDYAHLSNKPIPSTAIPIAPQPQRIAAEAGESTIVEQPMGDSNVCRPWMRIVKDPAAFSACMKLAAEVGAIEGHDKLYRILRDQMDREDQEVFVVALLDTQLHLRALSEVARGSRDRVPTPLPDVARVALHSAIAYGAMAVAVCHVHPSGKPNPSQADKEVTKAMRTGCESLGLLFLDHIVIGNGCYYSFHVGKVFRPRG